MGNTVLYDQGHTVERTRERQGARSNTVPIESTSDGGKAVPMGSASDVIELLDDDDDDDDYGKNSNNFVDMTRYGNRIARSRGISPIRDGEVEVLDLSSPNDGKRTVVQKKHPIPSVAAAATPKETSPLIRVLEIFPDADVNYVKKKLQEQKNNVEIVVAVLSENTDYPKQKKSSFVDISGKSSSIGHNNTLIRGLKSMEPKFDYSSPSASFDRSLQYGKEVIELLMYDFCFLRSKAIRSFLNQHGGRYTLTRNHIHDTIVGKSPNVTAAPAAAAGSEAALQAEKEEVEHYQLLRSILIRGSKPPEAVRQRFGGKDKLLKIPRKKIGVPSPPISDPILLDEHFHYERRFKEWVDKVKDRLRSQSATKMALEEGSAVQCSCCFDDVARSECVPCKEKGHLFCKECMVQYVESQVFGSGNLGIDKVTNKPALEIKCCEGSGCNSGFRDEILKNVLPPKTWEKYSEMQAKAQIERAGLGANLAMCPKCGYQAEVPEMQNIFECPVEHCQFSSCRKCGKASHIPLRCEEVVQKNRQDEGRLKVEEALSEAKMRTCPKCKKKFIKLDGCNKMTCACGMKMCYVCRKPLDKIKINVYSHFCQVPHCDHSSCGKCKLYTNDEEDDAQAMREAGTAAKQAFEAKIQEEDGQEGREAAANLNLDVDEMMRDPSRPQRKRKAPHAQPRVRHNNNNPPHRQRARHQPALPDRAHQRINERIRNARGY